MAEAEIKPSQRFTRAARAERDRLNRQRISVAQRRDDLEKRMQALDDELGAIDQRLSILDDLAGHTNPAQDVGSQGEGESGLKLVGGSTIRELALPILLRKGSLGPIHYREWYRLFTDAGYAAAGKRPDAVFLNQVSRSPLVKGTTKAGYYVLDLDVAEELRRKLGRQQAELSDLLGSIPEDGTSLARHQDRQRQLSAEIARTERDLRETLRVLEPIEGIDDRLDSGDPIQAQAA